MFQNKKYLSILAVTLSLSIFCGCGSTTPATAEGNSGPTVSSSGKAKTQYLSFACATMGSQGYVMAGTLSEIVNTSMPGIVMTATSGAAGTNLQNIENGSVQFAWSTSDGVADAVQGGTEMFPDPLKKLRLVACSYQVVVAFSAPTETGAESIYDIPGRKFNAFIIGGTLESTVAKLLKAHGITYDDIINEGGTVSHVGYDEQTTMLQDRQLEVGTYMTAIPSSAMMEVETSLPMHVLQSDPVVMKKFLEDNPAFTRYIIPAGTYKGQAQDAETVGVINMILCSADLDDDTVYDIVKVMWENVEKISSIHPSIQAEMTLENACMNLPTPLHPGAERFYKEKGVI